MVVVALVGMVLLRVVWLDSDAYPQLSWSSALLTDEGFYVHNARNLALFGHARTDGFNNMLIMPLLHLAQVCVFRTWGVSLVAARGISVVCSLLTLALFGLTLRAVWGDRVAAWGLFLLGLDHTNFLYSRLALMDTPATLPLVAGFATFTAAMTGKRRALGLVATGVLFGAAYAVRGLAALVWPVPLIACIVFWSATSNRREQATGHRAGNHPDPLRTVSDPAGGFSSNGPIDGESDSGVTAPEPEPGLLRAVLPYVLGLGLAILIYAVIWWWPHRVELGRVNGFYLQNQLLPRSWSELRQNIAHNLFGEDRGFSPYLFRHTPVQFILTAVALSCGAYGLRLGGESARARAATAFLVAWLLILLVVFGCIRYAPSRYYVLFYPPLAALTALALKDLPGLVAVLCRTRWACGLLGAFFSFQLAEEFAHHTSAALDAAIGTVALLIGAMLYRGARRPLRLPTLKPVALAGACLGIWLVVNVAWTGDWLIHLRYTQRDAERQLAQTLPVGAVLVGDAAPGLAIDSRFVAAPVIPGLCNDVHPLERFAGKRRYVVLLDGRRNEAWWRARYPHLGVPGHKLYWFPHVVKFGVSVYAVME